MINQLKQPTKYTHSSLTKQKPQQQLEYDSDPERKKIKTKQIVKLHDKKKINKKNEPSALRHAAINETFHKIQNKAEAMLGNFDVDHQLMDVFISYDKKVKCKCQKNIRFYCLKCMGKNQQLKFPQVQLPFHINVVHHSSEKINKSSIVPMALLSNSISLQTFNSSTKPTQFLKNIDKNKTCILFPHKNSKKVSQINFQQIKNVVILDCTWFQTDQLISCLEERGFSNFIRLDDCESLYWRYNHHSDKALSSGEALAYFLRQYQQHIDEDKTKYDQIMFLYLLSLKIIEQSYRKQSSIGQKQDQKGQKEVKNQT